MDINADHLKESFELCADIKPSRRRPKNEKDIRKNISRQMYYQLHQTFKEMIAFIPAISHYAIEYPIGDTVTEKELLRFRIPKDDKPYSEEIFKIHEQMEKFLNYLVNADPKKTTHLVVHRYDHEFLLECDPRQLFESLEGLMRNYFIENAEGFGSLYAAGHLLDRLQAYRPAKDLN